MWKISFLVLTISGLPGGLAAAQSDSLRARDVLAFEDRRFEAMRNADTTTLRGALSDALTYTHTSGRHDTKPSLLRSLASGALRYEMIVPKNRTVRFAGQLALVTGESSMRAGAPGNLQDFEIRYLAVYFRREGSWQLLAWQATRLPADAR
jgi:uncharacterized protein DUF4440